MGLEFKGTKEVHAVEYAGFIRMNDEPYYEGKGLLDYEQVGEEVAKANARLFQASYSLLEALEDLVRFCEDNEVGAELELAYSAIEKALK